MDELTARLPALIGWVGAFGVVAAACAFHPRLRNGLLVAHFASAVPVVNLVSGRLSGVSELHPIAEAAVLAGLLHIGLVFAAAQLIRLFTSGITEEDLEAPARRPPPAPAPPAPKPVARAPVVVRPAGAVASPGPAEASEETARRSRLLDMLTHSSETHRAAACRALVVPYASSKNRLVGRALYSLVTDTAAAETTRAEAAIALGLVLDMEVEDASSIRQDFGTLDPRWLDRIPALLGE